jgi:hypothetical protein
VIRAGRHFAVAGRSAEARVGETASTLLDSYPELFGDVEGAE